MKFTCLLRSVPVAAVQFKVRGTFYNMNRVQDGYFTLGAVSGQVARPWLAPPYADAGVLRGAGWRMQDRMKLQLFALSEVPESCAKSGNLTARCTA